MVDSYFLTQTVHFSFLFGSGGEREREGGERKGMTRGGRWKRMVRESELKRKKVRKCSSDGVVEKERKKLKQGKGEW